ncbi:NUDIX hydrolase [Megasphaera hominis]|jgi:ADP-ribose pyrophosphatase|uniref:NUDIX hydrolase n=1 Tax=Megasphaera hominis TaxID=159836 RepID=A0ABR6VF58_9FIRM|nr:NUDIX hydrolase [Megasphaera hominis]MBC3535774.1 NUDIX hydrolase [Megasphaera hominis]
MSISTETCIERKEIMKGHVLHVTVDKVSIDDGQGGAQTTSTREVVWHNGACAIVPVTDDGKIILVRQYRYAAALAMLEVPAGKIEHDGESPDLCAARELEEETGFKAGDMKFLGFVYTSPGFCNERIYLYLATNLQKGEQHLDEDEFMNLEYYTPEEVEDLIDSNEIVDAKTIANFHKAMKYLAKH